MFCVDCGNIIPKETEGDVTELMGRGREKGRTFSFSFTLCSECGARIDAHTSGGEEKAKRRKYEMELLDQLLKPEEVEMKLKEFDQKVFGYENGVFGR
jgi:hypothetical protein